MNEARKLARQWLRESSLKSFDDIIREAKLTKRQLEIMKLKFIDCELNYQIASELNISVDTVDKDINRAYELISRLLE